MASAVTPVGNNPFQPGMVSETYIPDQLIAGDLKIVTDSALVSGTAALMRGQIMTKDEATGVWSAWDAAGTGEPLGILVDNLDPSAGNVTGGIYLTGQFNGHCTTPLGTTLTGAQMQTLRNAGIFIKNSVVTASDPS